MAPRRRKLGGAVVVLAIVFLLVLVIAHARRTGDSGQSGTAGTGPAPVGTSGRAAGGGRAGAPRSVPVTAASARLGTMPVYLTGLGNVAASETVTVRTRIDGQLLRVTFREGQDVKEGDLLAEIDPRPFLVQLTQAQGQAAKDEAALQNARLDLQRYQALLAKDAISRQQVDTQVATVNQFAGAVESDRGAIEAARLNVFYTRITAPFAGRVGLRQVDPGNMVHASDQNGIVVLTRVRPINVIFTLPADNLQDVIESQRRSPHLTVEAWDRDLRTRLTTGTLLSVDNTIDPATGTVRLKAIAANEHDELYPNQFVNARLLLDTVRTVIVPSAAVQRGPQGTYVWVVRPDGRAEMRACNVRLTEGEQAGLASGVSAGERVVTDGVDRLQDGTRVQAEIGGGRGAVPGGRGGQPARPALPSEQGNQAGSRPR